jgi:signal transduction histidine kinase
MSDRPLRGTRLLLVEDDAGIRTTLGELLTDEGLVVTTAANGRQALQELRGAAPPDVIVLDLMMPVMDGWEFRVEQRGDPALADIPLVAMSADLSAKARAIAADGYVRKPIDFPTMLRLLHKVVEHAAQQRYAVADRLAALATLAHGIAHEINNPLTYMLANLQVLAKKLRDSGAEGELLELVNETQEGAERIRRIVRQAQMAAPSTREPRISAVDLRTALDEALSLTRALVESRATVVRDYPAGHDGPLAIRADGDQLQRLFVNLLRNAAQAIPEGHSGENSVRVSLRPLPSARASVEITDTGEGIPPEIRERIFQPFFTTRPVGQGTGLGLSICHAIVRALGGEIGFRGDDRRGTTFRVVLPLAGELEQAAPPPAGGAVAGQTKSC